MADHNSLAGAGQIAHDQIDRRLPDDREKDILATLAGESPPIAVSGSRGGNTALANLLAALEDLGLITDNTSA